MPGIKGKLSAMLRVEKRSEMQKVKFPLFDNGHYRPLLSFLIFRTTDRFYEVPSTALEEPEMTMGNQHRTEALPRP